MSSGLFTDNDGNLDPGRMFRDGIFIIILMASVVLLGKQWQESRRYVILLSFITCLIYSGVAGTYIYTYRHSLDKNAWYYIILYATIYIFLVFGFLIAFWVNTYKWSDDPTSKDEKKVIEDKKKKELESQQQQQQEQKKDKKEKPQRPPLPEQVQQRPRPQQPQNQ